jgi:Mrp family chromosome partitioning ATPase
MTSMLEALKQIQAKSPQTPPAIKPISPEELETFGLGRSPWLRTEEAAEAADPGQAAEAPPAGDSIEAPDCTEVRGSIEAGNSIEAADSTEPANSIETANSIEACHAVEAAGAIESSEAVTPPDPAQASRPAQPGEPGHEPGLPERTDEPQTNAIASESTPDAALGGVPDQDRPLGPPLSLLAEEQKEPYRELAGKLLAELSPGHSAAMMFTSADEGEDKTRTLASLAVVLAEMADGEIVVVDADFRCPALANRLGIWADRGLVDVLTGGADWRGLVRKTARARLSVLPAGKLPSDDGTPPSDLKIGAMLDALRDRYRLVLMNTAPLVYPEAAPLSRLCEGTYLVVELGRTGRRAARQAVRLIETCGGRVLGCVLVNVPPG